MKFDIDNIDIIEHILFKSQCRSNATVLPGICIKDSFRSIFRKNSFSGGFK